MARAITAIVTCHPMLELPRRFEKTIESRIAARTAKVEKLRTQLKSFNSPSFISPPWLATLSKPVVGVLDVEKFGYMAMLAFTVFGSFWLEIVLKTSVLRRWKRALISILPISTLFLIWDAYAIAQGHWFFNRDRMLGIYGPFDIPLEEFLFFIIVPMAAILTIEGVTTVKPHLREKEFGKEDDK
jgi:lycopene cyclase domain-containing protein